MGKSLDNGLSRRDALKLLGAAAGASVLANLPSRWSTPQSVAGVLPAHAATSCTRVFEARYPEQWLILLHYTVAPTFKSPAGAAPFIMRWECTEGCLKAHFFGDWEFTFPDGTKVTGPTSPPEGSTIYINLATGVYGIDLPPEDAQCTWEP